MWIVDSPGCNLLGDRCLGIHYGIIDRSLGTIEELSGFVRKEQNSRRLLLVLSFHSHVYKRSFVTSICFSFNILRQNVGFSNLFM